MAGKSAKTHIRIGIGGWNFAAWRNNFYPAGLPQQRELEYASRQLTAIEINSTFYRGQKPAVYANWRAQTPDGFVFSLKAPRFATMGAPANAGRSINTFVFGGLSELGDRLGPLSWQFAPNRKFARDEFEKFLDLLPRELEGVPLRHVLEVRHDSFRCQEFLALARDHRVATVFTDSPYYPSFADLTADFVYARLMRSEAAQTNGYPDAALEGWAARALEWRRGGEPIDLPRIGAPRATVKRPRDVFIYFISAAKERNPAAAIALRRRVEAGA